MARCIEEIEEEEHDWFVKSPILVVQTTNRSFEARKPLYAILLKPFERRTYPTFVKNLPLQTVHLTSEGVDGKADDG
jgi:hypothetical protein